jgi:uncharacterized protein (TIGR02594 family)
MFVRQFGYAAGTLLFGQTAFGNEAGTLPEGIGIVQDYEGPLPSPGTLGRSPALRAEQKVTKALLSKAPGGPNPYDVAKYFLAVGHGDYGDPWKPYIQGWPVRWNPVIVTFFQATDTKPEGDLTSWCAAFVNWCFLQAGKRPATHSASSGSFRSFGMSTSSPVEGDVVVFRRKDPAAADLGRGHVGFFVANHDTEVEVLGGNQIDGHDGAHMISSKRLSKEGKVLTLHSFRTDSRLHL